MSPKHRRIVAAALALGCMCAFAPAVRGEEGLWQTDFSAAKAKAKSEKKFLLVDFTGSDWCIWCKRLKAEVFDKDEFQNEAPKHFVLVELDFPSTKKLPDELKQQNETLQKKYEIHGFPRSSCWTLRDRSLPAPVIRQADRRGTSSSLPSFGMSTPPL